MTTPRISLWTLAAALAAASPAYAAPLDGATLQSRLPSAEIRVNFLGQRGMEDHVWRLQADGSITAVYMRAGFANDLGTVEHGGGTGRWSINGNQLCVQIQGIFDGRGTCFAIDAGPGKQVTLTGANPARSGSVFGFAPLNGGNGLRILRGTMETR